jgi:predicted  nucleic acid-binding Zn-ribbon protein
MLKKLSTLLAMPIVFAFFAVSCSGDNGIDVPGQNNAEGQLSASSTETDLSQLEEMIEDLKKQINNNSSSEVDVSQLEAKIEALREQVAAAALKEVDLSSLEKKLDALQQQIELQVAAASSKEAEQLTKILNKLEEKIDAIAEKEVNLESLEEKLVVLEKLIETAAADAAAKEVDLSPLTEMLASLMSQVEAVALKTDLSSLESELSALKAEVITIAAAVGDLSSLDGKLSALENQINEVETSLKSTVLLSLAQNISALEQQIASVIAAVSPEDKLVCVITETNGTINIPIEAPAVFCNGTEIENGEVLEWSNLTPKAAGKFSIAVSVVASSEVCGGKAVLCGIVDVAEPVLECAGVSGEAEKGVALTAPEVTCEGKAISYGLEWTGLTPVASGETEVSVKATKGVCKDKVVSCGTVTVPSEIACVIGATTGTKDVAITPAPTVTCDGATVSSGITWTPVNLVPTEIGSIAVSATVSGGACNGKTISCGDVTVSNPPLTYGTRFDPQMHGLTPGATTESVNLNWWSTTTAATSGTTTKVRLFDSEENLIKTIDGTYTNISNPASRRQHKATLTGLFPNTTYKYSVSNNGNDWSNHYTYKTPANVGAWRFAAVSDIQIPTSGGTDVTNRWKATAAKIADEGASFITSSGDQVDAITGHVEAEYTNFFSPPQLRSIPLAPVIGNHDNHSQYFNYYNMPNLSGSAGTSTAGSGNYYYLYNNILFVALNTGGPGPTSVNAAAPHITAFRTAIQNAKAAYPNQYDWIIVQHHKSTASVASHTGDNDIMYYVNAGFETLMCTEGVDLVLAGHDHIYVRSHLMTCDEDFLATKNSARVGKGFSVRSNDVNEGATGTMYLTLPSGSAMKVYSAWSAGSNANYPLLADYSIGAATITSQGSSNANKRPLSYSWHSNTPTATSEYLIFDVNGANMTVKNIRTGTGQVIDEFNLTPKGR